MKPEFTRSPQERRASPNANGGQNDVDEAFEKIRAELAEHPILRERIGGMFG